MDEWTSGRDYATRVANRKSRHRPACQRRFRSHSVKRRSDGVRQRCGHPSGRLVGSELDLANLDSGVFENAFLACSRRIWWRTSTDPRTSTARASSSIRGRGRISALMRQVSSQSLWGFLAAQRSETTTPLWRRPCAAAIRSHRPLHVGPTRKPAPILIWRSQSGQIRVRLWTQAPSRLSGGERGLRRGESRPRSSSATSGPAIRS